MSRTSWLWLLWVSLTVPAAIYVLAVILYGGNRSFLLIGKTTSGHHQIELACDACHTSTFGGAEVLQDACVKCHGAELKLANDSHPKSKFTDPRNADRAALLDAAQCVTCHREHRPGITRAMGVTMPDDYCVICHHDIGEDRPSHKGLAFTTCASAGCHNFHDNRALYADFLLKHANEPANLETQRIALTEWLAEKENSIRLKKPLAPAQANAPAAAMKDAAVLAAWAADVHAKGGVNCMDCHGIRTEPERWIAAPPLDTCKGCHAEPAGTFVEGKHGMRQREGLFVSNDGPFGLFSRKPLAPMTPAEARLPMKADAAHASLTCNSCHQAHDYAAPRARAEACAGCHDDQHTRAYFASPHYDLFKRELAGELPKGAGVSCATCHMPVVAMQRDDGTTGIFVTHNQNDNLRPNEKMVRGVCASCHGLAFTLDALADPALVRGNFKGRPAVHIEGIDWAVRRAKQRSEARK